MKDKLLQLKSKDDNGTEINIYPYTKSNAVIFDSGNTFEDEINNHNHVVATANNEGFMSRNDFIKLFNIEPNANKYYHPDTHDSSEIIHNGENLSDLLNDFSSNTEIQKLQKQIKDLTEKLERLERSTLYFENK